MSSTAPSRRPANSSPVSGSSRSVRSTRPSSGSSAHPIHSRANPRSRFAASSRPRISASSSHRKRVPRKNACAPSSPHTIDPRQTEFVMKIQPYLFFNGTCEAAFRFYEKALGGKIGELHRFKDMPPQEGSANDGCGGMTPEALAAMGEKVMHVNLVV